MYALRPNWDSPPPPTRRIVCPLPPVSGGRGTLAGEKGVGRVPIPTRGIHCGTLYMWVLCGWNDSTSVVFFVGWEISKKSTLPWNFVLRTPVKDCSCHRQETRICEYFVAGTIALVSFSSLGEKFPKNQHYPGILYCVHQLKTARVTGKRQEYIQKTTVFCCRCWNWLHSSPPTSC